MRTIPRHVTDGDPTSPEQTACSTAPTRCHTRVLPLARSLARSFSFDVSPYRAIPPPHAAILEDTGRLDGGGVGAVAYAAAKVIESREHYVIAVRRHEQVHFLLWFDDQPDGVVTADGRLVAFASDAEARAHADSVALAVSPNESAYFDLDELSAWVAAPNPYRIKPDDLLNAWNLLLDVVRTLEDELALARFGSCRDTYLTLVSCCDLPAAGFPTGERLTQEECGRAAVALRHGLACFDAALPGVR
jgi:hypothetical protein